MLNEEINQMRMENQGKTSQTSELTEKYVKFNFGKIIYLLISEG